ncbi:target of rapamycin complex 2 subunit [Arthroderma uncinatum]|uniref:target of rapamycin complex 2 subunit n=1 Tax=Arthroderma uncinatum TaxID=74035 RepID=UPI00144A7728|nr:target of rapamycin complex 2 subunit [Arthroderma uncinatum]KAF3482743.1 target of rapamycin complex 2 subunit [Arthroderma uncinatum]
MHPRGPDRKNFKVTKSRLALVSLLSHFIAFQPAGDAYAGTNALLSQSSTASSPHPPKRPTPRYQRRASASHRRFPFTIWQLRTSYLATIKDGVGDRLINVNSSILNSPCFRSAGWSVAADPNAAHIKRTHSPPIPTATAVGAQYAAHNAARRNNFNGGGGGGGAEVINGDGSFGGEDTLQLGTGRATAADDEEDEEITLNTEGMAGLGFTNIVRQAYKKKGSRQELGRRGHAKNSRRPVTPGDGEEDSSDLSDESDEETSRQRAVQQIQFTKMPVRHRADSSPIRGSEHQGGPQVLITSPSIRSVDNRFRRSSLGAVEAIKSRARRDTTTSSDMSSDIELDPEAMKRRQIKFLKHENEAFVPREEDEDAESEKLEEEVEMEAEMASGAMRAQRNEHDHDDDSIAGSVGSAISSDFGNTAGSGSLLGRGALHASSPLMLNKIPRGMEAQGGGSSPRKDKDISAPMLPRLPPAQPITPTEPVSLLSNMLNARKKAPENPTEKYAVLSGKGSSGTPLYIKLYTPCSEDPEEPMDMPLTKDTKDGDHSRPVTVAEAIGLALWRYTDDKIKPAIDISKLGVNYWNLRMVEDGEVDYDFPPLARKRPITDFTSNNNRAAGFRGRSRSKPYDEFALVEASPAEFEENETVCPGDSIAAPDVTTPTAAPAAEMPPPPLSQTAGAQALPSNHIKVAIGGRMNPILGHPFTTALNDSSLRPADLPAIPTMQATPRLGVSTQLKVRYVDLEASTRTTTLNTSTDSYIAEILDSVCKKWQLDKGNYLLKVMNSNTVAPLDRTVAALGNITDLELVRRRFGAGPLSLMGSPGSSSPNAPLLVDNGTAATSSKKSKKGAASRMLHPLAQKQDVIVGGYYKRYHVIRKQSMSFTTSSQRVLAFDNDYMHIMPAETGKTLFEANSKTTSISFCDVIGSKVSRRHPKSFRFVVLRGTEANEQKRYDFEAKNAVEAIEIVDEIKKNMAHYRL